MVVAISRRLDGHCKGLNCSETGIGTLIPALVFRNQSIGSQRAIQGFLFGGSVPAEPRVAGTSFLKIPEGC
ncbi:MAG: hypothetical protein A3G20_02300 [Acidobacteria bacterium RIFCSPLOWO2_12_FULL_59_11]|nr:MAG: hypothetical protein A3G20_02300 [Acidobacteria bacterium RIFCSPLOWO2_12_FULL_59_11]